MWGYIWNSQIMEEMCVRSESFTVIRAIVFSFPSCIFKENFPHGMTFLNWPKPLIYIRSYRALQRHIHLGHYFNSENRRNLNCCFFFCHCASNRVQSSTECSYWVSIPRYQDPWHVVLHEEVPSTASVWYIFFTSARLMNLVGICMRGLIFIPHGPVFSSV